MPPAESSDRGDTITFPNGRSARCIHVPRSTTPESIIDDLGIATPKAVILLSGGAGLLDGETSSRLVHLTNLGLARAAIECEAWIVDGGTQSGVMALIGEAVANQGYRSPLIGVTPRGRVSYPGSDPVTEANKDASSAALEQNHSHFVLVDSDEWGGESETMLGIPAVLAERGLPAVTVLINGGQIARDEVLRTVRHGWPLLVIEGSGRLADEIAGLWRDQPVDIPDPVMAEIIADGNIYPFPIDGFPKTLVREIDGILHGSKALHLAWERFALYDDNALVYRDSYRKSQGLILALGVVGTLFAMVYAEWDGAKKARELFEFGSLAWEPTLALLLHFVIVLVPITVSVLLAASHKFGTGEKYISLRAGAEFLKSEIYRYRTRSGHYRGPGCRNPDGELNRRVETISGYLMQKEELVPALRPYTGLIPPEYGVSEGDNGFGPLTPERFLSWRLDDQLNYYRKTAYRADRKLRRFQWVIYITGGVGTFLAARGLELWIALTTSMVAALTAYLGYHQTEGIMTKFSQAASDLENARGWWQGLTPQIQTERDSFDQLVSRTEEILLREQMEWMRGMEQAIASKDAQEEESEEETPPTEA